MMINRTSEVSGQAIAAAIVSSNYFYLFVLCVNRLKQAFLYENNFICSASVNYLCFGHPDLTKAYRLDGRKVGIC